MGEWLLRRFLPRGSVGESIRGDLYEEYVRRSHIFRDPWYLFQAVVLAVPYALHRFPKRRSSGGMAASSALFDIRHAMRRWSKRPGFTILVVVTLGLGIGATTATISVLDCAVLRVLPYPDPHELVTVWNTYPTWRGHEVLGDLWDEIALSYPEFVDWRDGQKTFQSVGIYTTGISTLTGMGLPSRVGFGSASSTVFPMLGAQPVVGRMFRSEEDGDPTTRVVVISHGLWTTRFGADPQVTERNLTVDGERYQVIGVLPQWFRLRSLSFAPFEIEIWVPAGIFGDAHDRGHHRYEAIARLRPTVSLNQAMEDAGPLLRGDRDRTRQDVRMLMRADAEAAASRGPLMLLFAGAMVFMVIACVNVTALFLSEVTSRRHEFATRSALGASKSQLVRQLLTESLLLALLGAVAGTALSIVGVKVLTGLAPSELALPTVPLNVGVLGVAAVLALMTGVCFGVGPAILASRSAAGSLRAFRTVSGDGTVMRAQRLMIAAESCLAVVLIVLSSVLTRSLLATERVDPGFLANDLIAVNLPVTGPRTQPDQMRALARELVAQVGSVQGVRGVTGSDRIPFAGFGGSSSFAIEGRVMAEGDKLPEAHRRSVLPGYHETLGIPVLAGRTIRSNDIETAKRVVVVSQALAERYWPGESPIGSFILRDHERWEVVGIVGDILHSDLQAERESTFYFPFLQQTPTQFWLVLDSGLDPAAVLPQIKTNVSRLAPEVAVGRVETMPNLIGQSTASARYRMTLVSVLGVLSVILASVGIFGMTARAVGARRRELGIRMALGARWQSVARSLVFGEIRAVSFGVVLGLVLASVATRSVSAFLFGIPALDPTSFLLGAAALLGAGWLATYAPARRIASVDPMRALRSD